MAIVYRNGFPYLYRSKRKGRRVTSEYVASGESALLIDQMEKIERDERDYQRWKEQEERKADQKRQRELDNLVADVRTIATSALESAGYHQHRGQWRRRRGQRTC
ncbi:hypothetical protein BH23PLA1_BH23PLA1_36180 [soil metagenome]